LRAPLPFTALHELEVPNALRLAIFRHAIAQSEADTAMASLDVTSPLIDW
jgi:hypothetical protein